MEQHRQGAARLCEVGARVELLIVGIHPMHRFLAMKALLAVVFYLGVGSIAAADCPGSVPGQSATLYPGVPFHIQFVDPFTCAVVSPVNTTVTQTAGDAVVTVVKDATGFTLSVPSNAVSGSTARLHFVGP